MEFDRRSTLLLLGGGAGGLIAARATVFAPQAEARVRANLYNCEGCEAAGQYARRTLSPVVQLASAAESGERMTVTGRILSADGTRPAPGVIVYAHHTNARGLYANGSSETVWSKRHGRLRGWAKTGPDGVYTFLTIKPAPYPDQTLPAHVHLFVVEPGRPPYYVDDVVFDGAFGVTPA